MEQLDKIDSFYKQLFSKAWVTIAVIFTVAALDIWVVSKMGSEWIIGVVFTLTIIKIFFIVQLSFNQLVKIIGQSHLLSHILVLFALLIGLIILSFASDYATLHLIDGENFRNDTAIGNSIITVFFEYLYLSTITFSSVGYGDIVPVSIFAKATVMLEVALRFFVLVFGIANINNIKIDK